MMLFQLVCCTIPERGLDKDLRPNCSSVPMCNIFLMHKSEALCKGLSGANASDQVLGKSYITYLSEECHELAERLETGLIEGAQ